MISASADTPLVAGEWSISPVDDTGEMAADSSGAAAYYTQLSSAAMSTYEKNVAGKFLSPKLRDQEWEKLTLAGIGGWMFWSWKTDLGAPFWDYQYGVVNGFIPKVSWKVILKVLHFLTLSHLVNRLSRTLMIAGVANIL